MAGTKRHPHPYEYDFVLQPSLLEIGGALVGLAVASWLLGIGVKPLTQADKDALNAQLDQLAQGVASDQQQIQAWKDTIKSVMDGNNGSCILTEKVGDVYVQTNLCETAQGNIDRLQADILDKQRKIAGVKAKLGIPFSLDQRTRFDPSFRIF